MGPLEKLLNQRMKVIEKAYQEALEKSESEDELIRAIAKVEADRHGGDRKELQSLMALSEAVGEVGEAARGLIERSLAKGYEVGQRDAYDALDRMAYRTFGDAWIAEIVKDAIRGYYKNGNN